MKSWTITIHRYSPAPSRDGYAGGYSPSYPCLSMGSRPAIPAQPAIACAAAPPIKTPMPEASPAFPIRSALTPARPLRRRRLSPAPSRSMSGPSSRPRLNGGGRPHIDFAVHRDTEDVGASIGASGSRVRSRSEPISTRSTTDLDAEPDRSRAGSGPISTRSTTDLGDQSVQSPLTAVAAALTFTTAIGLVVPVFELAALGVAG